MAALPGPAATAGSARQGFPCSTACGPASHAAVKAPHAGIEERDIVAALASHWGLAVIALDYLAVGFGDHHWIATEAGGRRWFVTVAELGGGWRGASPEPGWADLRAAMDAVIALREAGLEFALAPVPARDGQALARLDDQRATTVFPYLEGTAGTFGRRLPQRDRLALTGMLARLHGATAVPGAAVPVRDLPPASLPGLRAALSDLGRPWAGGPYSEPARHFLARHRAGIAAALTCFDDLARQAAASGPPVITHGEPHPGNVLRSGSRIFLIDWDTVGLALPERDLWHVAGSGSPEVVLYCELTGRMVSNVALAAYRLRWQLDDLALSVALFRGPHARDENTAAMWADLPRLAGDMARPAAAD
jgi:spectinomycin phosphotransferase